MRAAIAALCLLLAANARADCTAYGATTLISSSNLRIEVDGLDSGCNADATQYSYGNVVGEVRVSGRYAKLPTPEFISLTFDQPLTFHRFEHPYGGEKLYKAGWETREGYFVEMSFHTSRADEFEIDEFAVFADRERNRLTGLLYNEWQTQWRRAETVVISGQAWADVDQDNYRGPGDLPFADVAVELYKCQTRDGLVATTRTASDGSFSFPEVEEGTYQLRAEAPDGWEFALNINNSVGTGAEHNTIFPWGFSHCWARPLPRAPVDTSRNGIALRASN